MIEKTKNRAFLVLLSMLIMQNQLCFPFSQKVFTGTKRLDRNIALIFLTKDIILIQPIADIDCPKSPSGPHNFFRQA
ncbi:hypothetical protein CBI36_04620 [Acetobacter oryzifermentans]|uniref:Uncharacterized protein n=2 Tax=Acetobacter TaxID=434 RepID=A0AAN1U9F5_9PROT|nr:hypothetical protein CBI36_04620 [Acetobacter oryzifermentans]AXN00775.1 hypothetical protein CJF59_09585 [Acetobacter pomorum]KAA8397550.1 hypothetical protein FKW22_04475 [Acetobacter sp. DmW_125124]